MHKTSLAVQGLRLHLPIQGVQILPLVRELDLTSLAAKKPNHKTEAIFMEGESGSPTLEPDYK